MREEMQARLQHMIRDLPHLVCEPMFATGGSDEIKKDTLSLALNSYRWNFPGMMGYTQMV